MADIQNSPELETNQSDIEDKPVEIGETVDLTFKNVLVDNYEAKTISRSSEVSNKNILPIVNVSLPPLAFSSSTIIPSIGEKSNIKLNQPKTSNFGKSSSSFLNKKDNNGDTPLFHAINTGNSDLAIRLINKGANLNLRNKKGQTPLSLAITHKLNDVIDVILNQLP